ncbi:probable serine/threonine-protein kinase At1g54610 [Solanum dulcamara]|uniref:probable serine/threonine-protein kinase At1g54610 n=1 Tax=Solanum dulcamara TaxID=45834 RepID=UPI0024861D68|nr:probable serine/threonine-protein kinase At1g54610 [Solanum dulcamara]
MGSSHGKSSTIRDQSVEVAVSSEKEEILHTRRRKPNPRLSRGVPKGIEGELVVAGWPNWLVAVAGDALNGWLPRKADTFNKIDKIGQGTYSYVYKAHDCLLNKFVALKKVRFDNFEPESVKFLAREIIILRRLGDHPNVIKLEGLAISKMHYSLYLVFDCMEYDLKAIQEQKGVKFSEPEIKCYMNQLLKGLDHCHSRGILHRDVTTSNLLVDKYGILKITDFGLSIFFDPEQSIPLTSKIVTLWYRPPELLLGSNCYGVGVDLWGVGCVLGELFTGKPIMPGKTEVDQLHKIFKLCGSPSDDFWLQSKLPNAKIFKPIKPYRRILHTAFYDLPAAAVGLIDTLLSLKAEYRGTAALALQNEFFTTKPFACDPSSLPQCPPSKEIDAKKTEIMRSRNQKYARDRSVRAFPYPEANAELKSNIDRRQLLTHSKARDRLEKINECVSEGVLNEGTNSSECFQVSSRKEGSENYTQIFATPNQRNNQRAIRKEPIHDDHDIKGKKKWSGPLPAASDKMQDLLREHDTMILKTVTHARLEKGSTAKGNDHDSKGKMNHSLGPSTTLTNDQISTLLLDRWTNMQGLPREHAAWILKDAQWVMSDKKKMSEGEGNNSNQLIEQLLPPAESDGFDFLEDNQYFGPPPSVSKPIDVDRIIREHDR